MKKKMLFVLVTSLFMCLFVSVSAHAITQAEAVNWAKAQIGTAFDVDNGSGYQCSDFGTAYINYIIYGNAYYKGDGAFTTYYGRKYYDLTYPIGWQRIANTPDFVPQPGDILCFAGNSANSAGHVAVALEGCTVSVMYGVGQNGLANDGWGEEVKRETLPYYGDWGNFQGVIRPQWDNFPTPANLGTDFYAIILHKDSWKPIEVCNDNFVRIGKENGYANQVWKFKRESNGCYTISSALNKHLLEAYQGVTNNGNPTAAAGEDWGGNYQRWYIYKYDNGYIIKSKHYADLNRVLDIPSNNTADGAAVTTYERNNSRAQIFEIYKGDDVQLKSPTLSAKVNQINSTVTFDWTEVYGELRYDVKIWKNKVYQGDAYHIEWNAGHNYSIQLPPGYYEAYVDAANQFECKMSNIVGFTVTNPTYTITFNANGGSTPTSSKTVTYNSTYGDLPTPTRAGYTFTGWFTAASGGTQIKKDTNVTITANQTLYAQWKVNNYTVTFNANGGSTPTTSKTVTYNSTYGDLPTPTRTGYTFAGWFTAASGGAQVTKDTKVTITANQTLYAQWKPFSYTVKYNANGGTGTTADSVHSYDSEKALTKNGFTKKYYTFTGWNTKPDGSGSSYANGAQIKNLTAENGGTITLYAQWKRTVSTKTTLESHGSYTLCNVKISGASAPCRVVLAAYKGNKLISAETRAYSSENESFAVVEDFDTVKVMVWNGLDGMEPVSEVEIVRE